MQAEDLVVLISGATHGIGKAISKKFVNDGWTVVQNSRNVISDLELIGAKHYVADVTKMSECEDLIKSVIEKFGKLDALICNVGSGVDVSAEFSIMERWDHFLTINLSSASNLISAAMGVLLESKGSVIAISSICGIVSVPGAPVEYSAAKTALNRYIQSLASNYGKNGLRFNVVAPGNVLFEGSSWHRKIQEDGNSTEIYISEKVPLGGFVAPEEIAAAVAFLASQESKSTTGVVLVIDRGQTLWA